MNKRIQELYKQAYGYFSCPTVEPETEKFAELIVQDCISQIAMIGVSNDDPGVRWTVDEAIHNIREHFGVEE